MKLLIPNGASEDPDPRVRRTDVRPGLVGIGKDKDRAAFSVEFPQQCGFCGWIGQVDEHQGRGGTRGSCQRLLGTANDHRPEPKCSHRFGYPGFVANNED